MIHAKPALYGRLFFILQGEDSPFAAMCSPVKDVRTARLYQAARIRRYPLVYLQCMHPKQP